MKKRILSFMMTIVACAGLCFGLAGCNQCAHVNKNLIEDTATCENDGVATYLCDDCGKTITEESKALNHDYSIYVGDSATCTTSGYVTNKCSRCDATKNTYSSKKEHQYKDGQDGAGQNSGRGPVRQREESGAD